MLYGRPDISKNKKIMQFFMDKIEKDDSLVKNMNKYYSRTSFFGLLKNIGLVAVVSAAFVGTGNVLLDNGNNNMSVGVFTLLVLGPTLLSTLFVKMISKRNENLRKNIISRIENTDILNLNDTDLETLNTLCNEEEMSFLLDLLKEKLITGHDILENIRNFASVKNETKKMNNNKDSQNEITEHLIRQEQHIDSQLEFYKYQKESLLKKKALIESLNNEERLDEIKD